MATLTTKYSIGDTVYLASTTTEKKRHPCPDCLGSREWEATSPAGTVYKFGCPRCSASYQSDRDLSLDYSIFVPSTRPLTVGSIQYNTEPGSYDHGARYMCRETGIGSGSVYSEIDLYSTEAEAIAAAQVKADLHNQTTPWVIKQFNKSLEISDYQLSNAALKKASDEKSRAYSMLWNLRDLFSRIDDADGKDAILEAIEEYKTYDWERDKLKAAEAA